MACKPSVLLAPGRKRLWGGPLQEQVPLGVAQVRVGKALGTTLGAGDKMVNSVDKILVFAL